MPNEVTISEQCYAIAVRREGDPDISEWSPWHNLDRSIRLYGTEQDALNHIKGIGCEGLKDCDLDCCVVPVTVAGVGEVDA